MAGKPHILIIDDDRRIRRLLQGYLADHGFRATTAADAAKARAIMAMLCFELIVADIMMPGESGLDLLQSLRGSGDRTPVLMLSARAETQDRIAGLSLGGDDYLTKPFEPRELLLRIENILRRQPATAPEREAVFGPCRFHPGRGELRRHGQRVHITTRERDILRLLAASPGQPVPRAALTAVDAPQSLRAVDMQINRLRGKIESDPTTPLYLQTVRGIGYTLHVEP